MSQTTHFLISLVWAVGIIILILAVCALAVRWIISAFKLQRDTVMRVFFILACLFLMVANAGYAFASGFSHSAVEQDQACCILMPFVWIGKNMGIRQVENPLPFFVSIVGLWLAVMLVGLYLSKRGKSPFWALLLPPSLSLLSILFTSVMGWEFGRQNYEKRDRYVYSCPPLAVPVESDKEVKISPEVVIQEIRRFSAKGRLVESDLEKLNQMAKADRSALLKALIAAGNSATTTDEMDISVGMIAYYDFSIEELVQGKKTATPAEVAAYDALIRETKAGDVKIRRDEVIARLKETRKGLNVSRLHQIELKVGMERQKVEEQVAKALSRTNQYSPYGNNLTGGIVQYPDGDWVLEVKYKAGAPGPLVANPDGKVQGYPPMDETVLEYAIKGKPVSEGKALLKAYKGDVVLPAELYQTYENLVATLETGKQEMIEKFCMQGKVAFTTEPRPKDSREYGRDINLPYLKDGFNKFIITLRKDSDTDYLVRTGSTGFWFTLTEDGKWKLVAYLDKPIE